VNVIKRAAFNAKVDVDEQERTVVATINTDALDRYRTVILPEGGLFENYRKNPVVLANHGEGGGEAALPIGRNLWIKSQKGRLVAKTQFLPPGKLDLADKVFELYRLEYLNAWSISFDPRDYGPPKPDEVRKRPELAECRCVIRTWDLLEYSCVTLPGNPEATRAARARGLALPSWPLEELAAGPQAAPKPELPPLVGRPLDAVLRGIGPQLLAHLKPELDRAVQDAQDLARGRV
jgi:hypothetical protein